MRASTKVGIGLLIVLIALMAALWPRNEAEVGPSTGPGLAEALPENSAETPGTPVDAEELAGRPLAGLMLESLTLKSPADASPVDVGAALAGKPAVLNLWAPWCAPCREELPVLAEFADRAGDAVTVMTVHKDKSRDRALAMLDEIGVRLPGVDDPGARIAAAVGAPNVLPVTILLRADGSVAAVLAVPFTDTDQIAAAVREHLGVQV